jgi:dihydrofolate reductase
MIKAIFAVDHWGGMGLNGTLPWPSHSEDFQYFKQQTVNQVVIMGRKTWDDPKMPKPLPDRISYVVTSTPIRQEGVYTIQSNVIERIQRIADFHANKTVWIIGGPTLLEATKDIIEELHVTHFKSQYKTDAQLDLRRYLSTFRFMGCRPSSDRSCTWVRYKNVDIFRP